MFGWFRRNTTALQCGSCRGSGNCPRCRGYGTLGNNEVRGDAIVVGPIPCPRCTESGTCTACSGSGWIFPPRPDAAK